MNRSDFFRRLGLAVAALFVPKAVEGELDRGTGRGIVWEDTGQVWFKDIRIYGDGIHDDTEALQALIDGGKRIVWPGIYRITNTLNLSHSRQFVRGE